MNRILSCVLMCCCLPLAAANGPQVERLIPADAEFAAFVRDLPDLKSRWASSPFADLWGDAAVKAFFEPFHRQLAAEGWNEKLVEETGYDFDELAALFPGGIAVYIPDLMGMVDFIESEDDEATVDVPLVVMVDAGERIADLEALLLRLEEREAEDNDGESPYLDVVRAYRDVDMHIEQRIDLEEPKEEVCWAAVASVLALAGSPDLLQAVIDDVLDGPQSETLLTSTAGNVGDHLVGRDLYVYVDLQPLVPFVEEQIAAALAEENPMGVDPDAVMRAVRLDAAQASFVTFDLDGQTTRVGFGATMTSDVGVFQLMALDNKPLRKVPGIPAEAANFSVSYFDFQQAWKAVEDIVNAVNPMYLALAGGQLKGWQEAQGVQLDLRGALLDNLQSEIVAIQLKPDIEAELRADLGTEDQLTVLTISDREAFERLVDALKSGVSQGNEMFEQREFLGTTIWTAKAASPDAATPRFAYAITDRHVYLSMGTGRTLEAVLMDRSREDSTTVWDLPEIKRAATSVSGEVASFAYQATDVWMERVFHMMAMACTVDDDGEYTICDPTAVPAADVFRRYLGPLVTTLSKGNDQIVGNARIMAAQGDES